MGCDTSALSELARWLQSLRRSAGLSYRQMSEQSTLRLHRSVHFLKFYRADRGRSLPAWQVIHDYVRICGGDLRRAERLWKRAASPTTHSDGGTRQRFSAPLPQHVAEPFELLGAMRALRFRHGNKSLRELEQAAIQDGVSHLPRSTLGAVLSGRRVPSRQLVLTFVRACSGAEFDTHAARVWEQAWVRADAHKHGQSIDLKSHTQRQEPAQTDTFLDPAVMRSARSVSSPSRVGRRSSWWSTPGLLSFPPTPLHAGRPQGP